MKLNLILETLQPIAVHGSADQEILGLAYNSREVRPGWLFVAVSGHTVDGAEYVTEAVANGAVAVVSEHDLDLGSGVTHVQVACARKALAEIAAVYYGRCADDMKLVGVTGTNGKTTTSYMIRKLLLDGGFLPGLLGTVAYEIGGRSLPAARTTPEAPDLHSMFQQMQEAGCDSVVMEVSSHAISLHRVHGIDFDISVFTNLTQDHLDYHHDMETYFDVKAQLFERMGQGRPSVINVDDAWGRRMVEEKLTNSDVVTYGFDEQATVYAAQEQISEKGTQFKVFTPWGDAVIHLRLLGRFNVHNALAAIGVGGLCGIDLKRMAVSLAGIEAIPGRLELVPNRKKRKIFVDYAHTDDALKNVLTTLREICKGRLIVVFGCGGNRDRGKRKLMGGVAADLADYSIITSDNPRKEDPADIMDDIIQGFSGTDQFETELDRRTAIGKGIKKMGRRDILLVAGKGHETYQEIEGAVIPFDDREVIQEFF